METCAICNTNVDPFWDLIETKEAYSVGLKVGYYCDPCLNRKIRFNVLRRMQHQFPIGFYRVKE